MLYELHALALAGVGKCGCEHLRQLCRVLAVAAHLSQERQHVEQHAQLGRGQRQQRTATPIGVLGSVILWKEVLYQGVLGPSATFSRSGSTGSAVCCRNHRKASAMECTLTYGREHMRKEMQ